MHPSLRATRAYALAQPSRHADRFSFPPTQETGLLDSPTVKPGSANATEPHAHRSANQHDNLQDSFSRLLDALDRQTPRCALA